MTTSKPTRGGLAALIFGLLVAVFVGAQFFAAASVHAQAPAGRRACRGSRAAETRARLRRQDARELHTELRRHRLDAHLGGAGPDDDHSRPRPVLWRHGAQEERRRHRDDELRHHLPRHRHLDGLHLLDGVPRRHALHRRVRPRLPAGHPERHLQGHRQSQSARADHSGDGLYLLPDDLRDHHPGADRRRLRRAHEVLGDAVVHRTVGDLRLCADRALGVGTGRLHELRPTRRPRQGAGLRRRHGGARQCRRRRPDVRAHARQAQGHRPRPQHGADLHRRLARCGSAGSASMPAPR